MQRTHKVASRIGLIYTLVRVAVFVLHFFSQIPEAHFLIDRVFYSDQHERSVASTGAIGFWVNVAFFVNK